MARAIKADPAFADAYSMLGSWYQQERQWDAAIAVWQDASRLAKGGAKAFSFPLARCLHESGRAGEASDIIARYANEQPQWKILQQQNQLFMRMRGLTGNNQATLVSRVNTCDPELFPWLDVDGHRLHFTRRVRGMDEDFFKAEADSCGGWLSPNNLGSPPNTLAQESAQMVSADGHYLFFHRCENRSDNGWDGGGCDLYLAYRVSVDSPWSVEQPFGATINTPAFEGMPSLSADNRVLFFVSDRPGGYGGLDIWSSRFENGLWQEPRNLGPTINTAGAELAPYLHADNQTLYFTSDGHPTIGGTDILYAKRDRQGRWSQAALVDYPINSPANEMSLCIQAESGEVVFGTDRAGRLGDFDLFSASLSPQQRPEVVSLWRGIVCDSITNRRITNAEVIITDAETGSLLYQVSSNRGDGALAVPLKREHTYWLRTERVGYQTRLDTLRRPEARADTVQAITKLALLPDGYVAPIHDSLVVTIRFPLNAATMSDSERLVLRQLIEPWKAHTGRGRFLINGYTDATGPPLLNEQLSFARARLVMNEMKAMGITPSQMEPRGWGEANPIAANDSEEHMALNRRVEVIFRQ